MTVHCSNGLLNYIKVGDVMLEANLIALIVFAIREAIMHILGTIEGW